MGVDGAIIEDYHGNTNDVYETLKRSSNMGLDIVRGINLLIHPYQGMHFADAFDAKFVQFDSVQSNYIDVELYTKKRKEFSDLVVLGDVGFKYTTPSSKSIQDELDFATSICDAVVTTGSGTGITTPTQKLIAYKNYLGDFPLVVGAGVDLKNAHEQLSIVDGAIVGSYFKPGKNTQMPVDPNKVTMLVDIVQKVRKNN